MNTIEKIREKNPNRKIYELKEKSFDTFGRVLNLDLDSSLVDYMKNEAGFPKERNIYVASDSELEKSGLKALLENEIYSGMECQFGYCNGLVSHINGFEFHQCSEVFISITDCMLALIKPHQPLGSDEPYEIENSFLYYVPAGTALELYPMVGHFSPIRVYEEGYRSVIILLKGTNEGMENTSLEDMVNNKNLGFAKNKWLYVHEDRMDLVEKGAHLHVYGDNSPLKVL